MQRWGARFGRTLALVIATLVLSGPALAADLPPEVVALQAEAARDVVSAQFTLAEIYDRGEDVPPDLRKAREWYCKAAHLGHPEAAWRMSQIFLIGWGVPADIANSRAWLRVAAEHGHFNARAIARAMAGRIGSGAASCTPRRLQTVPAGYHYAPGVVPRLPPGFSSPPPERIVSLVRTMAPRYGLDATLVLAVIDAESGFRAGTVSHRGACGLMQLIPETAARFGVLDVFDPEDNLRGGMSYLRWLMARFQGDVRLVLAGYNAGEGAVEAHRGVPPFSETQTYVRRILGRYPSGRHAYDPSAASPSKLLTGRSGG